MKVKKFSFRDYIDEGDWFHFSQKVLTTKRPSSLHTHDYYEVFLVVRGAVDHWLTGRVDRLEKGDLVFVRPHDAHALSATDGGEAEIINIMFIFETTQLLGERYYSELNDKYFWHARVEPDVFHLDEPRFERAVNTSRELQMGMRSLVRAEEFMLCLMVRVVDYTALANAAVPRWLLTACTAAKRPEVFRDGAAGFVKAAGRGHEHVCRMAKEYLGVTPSSYVNEKRMEYAAFMLAGSELTVDSIAYECGVENLSHFYRLFRRQYGVTPRKYRARNQKPPAPLN